MKNKTKPKDDDDIMMITNTVADDEEEKSLRIYAIATLMILHAAF